MNVRMFENSISQKVCADIQFFCAALFYTFKQKWAQHRYEIAQEGE
jgi:hypothetical protein